MAAMERGNTQYRYAMLLYMKGEINCFAERMCSTRALRDSTCQTLVNKFLVLGLNADVFVQVYVKGPEYECSATD